jgi:hypothetical protein
VTDLVEVRASKNSSAADPEPVYVVRLATAYLVVPHTANADVTYGERLKKSLLRDARVVSAFVPALEQSWSPQFTVYSPLDRDGDTTRVLEATRHVHVQRFSDPIGFKLRVPTKNQPKVFEYDEIPSEEYYVLWDGVTLLVGWRQSADKAVGNSGGHIIEEILAEAASRIDADVLVQACNPLCQYVFIHTAIRVEVRGGADSWTVAGRPGDPYLLDAVLPRKGDGVDELVDVAVRVWGRTAVTLRAFAAMKSQGRQILELEALVRNDLDLLNRLHHERASARQKGWRERLRALWRFRHWRRTSRYYLARLWLGLGNLERLKRGWTDKSLQFRRRSDEANLGPLFHIDSHGEVSMVEQLELDLIETAVEHASDRLNTSVVSAATLGGAVAGAIVAAILTAA